MRECWSWVRLHLWVGVVNRLQTRLISTFSSFSFHISQPPLLSFLFSCSLCLTWDETFSIFYVLFVLRFAYCFSTQPAVVNCYNNNKKQRQQQQQQQQMLASGNFNFGATLHLPSNFMKRIITQISINECQAISLSHSRLTKSRSPSLFLSLS